MIGLGPQTLTVARLAGFVTDEQLSAGTPCPGPAVRNLLGHLLHLCVAFRDAARRDPRYDDGHHPERPVPDIGPGRREEPAAVLDELADARRDPDAWTSMTRAGGVDLPGDVAGAVVVEELVVHGWDLAHPSDGPVLPTPRPWTRPWTRPMASCSRPPGTRTAVAPSSARSSRCLQRQPCWTGRWG